VVLPLVLVEAAEQQELETVVPGVTVLPWGMAVAEVPTATLWQLAPAATVRFQAVVAAVVVDLPTASTPAKVVTAAPVSFVSGHGNDHSDSLRHHQQRWHLLQPHPLGWRLQLATA